ncbi:MAG: glycosyltransferase family 39 protein, partial [Candidatus Omnitrophica bacterium]|nr:glycosyltransferase family 39 protein [Candidatus Omnitrophota bacterium]
NHQLFFLLIWWSSFFLYPLWHLPASDSIRIVACAALFAIFAVCSLLFRLLIHQPAVKIEKPQENRESTVFFSILFTVVLAAHIPFLPWPILTGLDTIDHAVVPGVIAHKIVQGLSSFAGFSIQPILTFAALVLLIAPLVSPSWRRYVSNRFTSLAQWADKHFGRVIVILAIITILYAALLLKFKPLDRFHDLNPLFRYPPLSKFLSIPLYAAFGLQEWTGRLMQILFTFGGSIYIYRLARLYGSIIAGRAAAVIYVLLPPLFHYGNTTMIEGGTLFLMTAAFFHWIRYIEQKSHFDLSAGALFALMACLYKHPGVSLIPAFAFMAAYDFIFPRERRDWRSAFSAMLACALPAAAIVLYMKLSGFNSDVPSSLQWPSLERLTGSLQAVPRGVTLPIALLFAAGLLSLPVLQSWRTFWIFTGWIAAHYWLTCMSAAAMNVRQALPYYLGFIVPASLLLERCAGSRRKMQAALIYGALPLFLLWACLWMDRNQDYRLVGRAMGDRSYINFSNWNSMYLPYPQTVRALQKITSPGDVIYAPMINEPVYFYLEKYRMTGRVYRRELWTDFDRMDLSSLLAYCRKINAEWLVVPRGRWLYVPHADLAWIERLFNDPPASFLPVEVAKLGAEQIGIWRIKDSPR